MAARRSLKKADSGHQMIVDFGRNGSIKGPLGQAMGDCRATETAHSAAVKNKTGRGIRRRVRAARLETEGLSPLPSAEPTRL